MSLLQMSVSAAVMIAAVLVIRALAINRLPKKTFLALWGIVLARLLLPFSWPSPFSVYSLANRPGIAGPIAGAPAATVLPIAQAVNDFTIAPTAGLSTWVWIWGIGTVLCTLYFAVVYVKCRREFMTTQPIENAFTVNWLSEHQCKRSITIRQTSGISAPLTYGIFRPVILMPAQTDWTDKRKLQYVLAHEYVHIRRFDGATKLILTAALCAHWFNPLVWVMYVLANRDMELSCDEKVVRIFGETIKSAYALALISMEEKKSGLTSFCNNFSKNAIEERIEAIMKMKKTSIAAVIVALCLVGGVTAVFATSAIAKDQEPMAYSTNAPMLPQEQEKADQLRKEETAKQYSIYENYGLTYDTKADNFYYNGKLVRFFSDKLDSDNHYNSFVRSNDGVDLFAVRNAKYELIGIRLATQEEYDKRTESIKTANATTGGRSGNGGIASSFDPEYVDDSLKAYVDFDVTYDKDNKHWMYNSRPIHVLFDGENLTYVDNSTEAIQNGISIKVVRNASGQIKKLTETREVNQSTNHNDK